MTFSISDSQFWKSVQIEEETNSDVSAGMDLGSHLGEYIADAVHYINDGKLIALLEEELDGILSPDEIIAIANQVQSQVRHQIQQKSA